MAAKKIHLKNHRGATLLYGLLVMMIVTAIATIVGTLTVRQIQSGRAVKDAIVAYYGAESALEAGLYMVAENRFYENETHKTLNETLNRIDSFAEDWAMEDKVINDLTMDITKKESFTPEIKSSLEENETLQLDFVDSGAPPLEYLDFTWDDAESNGRIEVTSTGWNNTGSFSPNSKSWPFVVSGGAGSSQVNIRQAGAYNFYRVRIKMVKGSVQGLTVTAHKSNGDQIDIPSHIFIIATGSYAGSKQAVSILAPWKLPSSALGDFVLFSDDELLKEFDPCGVLPC